MGKNGRMKSVEFTSMRAMRESGRRPGEELCQGVVKGRGRSDGPWSAESRLECENHKLTLQPVEQSE